MNKVRDGRKRCFTIPFNPTRRPTPVTPIRPSRAAAVQVGFQFGSHDLDGGAPSSLGFLRALPFGLPLLFRSPEKFEY